MLDSLLNNNNKSNPLESFWMRKTASTKNQSFAKKIWRHRVRHGFTRRKGLGTIRFSRKNLVISLHIGKNFFWLEKVCL